MSRLPFSLFKQGNDEYEVVDRNARKFIFSDKVLIITDSYGNTLTPNNKSFKDIAEDLMGVELEMVAKNSAGFGGGSPHLVDALSDYQGNKNEIELILIAAGANDCSTVNTNYSDIMSGISAFDAAAKANYPNAKIAIMPIGVNYANANGIDADARYVKDLAYYEGAAIYGWIYAENSQYLLHDTRLLKNDLLHPSEAGIKAIGEAIAQFLRSGVVTFCHRMVHSSFDSLGSNIASASINAEAVFENSELTWSRSGSDVIMEVSVTTAITVSGASIPWLEIGTLNTRMFDTFNNGNKWLITVPCIIADSSLAWHNGTARIVVQHGRVYCDIYTDATSVKWFKVLGDYINIPKR